jgi:integrase
MRLGEVKNLKMSDIERTNKRILVRQGKGAKDRYTLLPKLVLEDLEKYYRQYRPKVFMFENNKLKDKVLHERSVQTIVYRNLAGFRNNVP